MTIKVSSNIMNIESVYIKMMDYEEIIHKEINNIKV